VFRILALLTAAAVLGLAACGKTPAGAPAAASQEPQAAYVAPPSVLSVTTSASGAALTGSAPPNAKVRLATPGGEARFVQAGAAGAWSLVLPPSSEVRIFGLSAAAGGRQVQAQGYVLVSPDGRAGLLRAGAGALRLDRRPPTAIGAIDFDREGSTVVSGTAPAQAYLSVEVDGAQAAQGRADAQGRFSIALQAPLRAGRHQVNVVGDGLSETARFEASPAAPLAPGPIHSQVTPDGLRVDWPTPGGGIQSTVLVN
jgi:hypothetical protein